MATKGGSACESSIHRSSSRSRTPTPAQLASLFSNSPQQSRSASPVNAATALTGTMPFPKVHRLKSTAIASASKPQSPIVRWLDCNDGAPTQEPEQDEKDPSAALQQAIIEQLPHEPLPAHINPPPNLFMSSNSLRGRPLMNSLARSTFPTSSLSCGPDTVSHLPILVSQSSPTRTSLDSLRMLHDRNMHVSASQNERSTLSSFRSWFQWDKHPVDQLLEEADRADTAKGEAERICRKCRLLLC